jgi:uncharacterized membrane protein
MLEGNLPRTLPAPSIIGSKQYLTKKLHELVDQDLDHREDIMERLLAVVFDKESSAYEAARALNQLDAEGSITVYNAQVIEKNADGTATTKDTEAFPLQTAKGYLLGSLVGLLGGPVGLGIGMAVGTTAGMIGDVNIAGLNSDFVNDVTTALRPGKFALLADLNEEWVTPVDTRMESLGGVVFRTARKEYAAEDRAREVALLKSDMDSLKAEHAQARAETKAKLQGKIDVLNTKLQRKLEEAKQRSQQMKDETDARVKTLQTKAAIAKGDAKTKMESRINQLREEADQASAKLKSLAA